MKRLRFPSRHLKWLDLDAILKFCQIASMLIGGMWVAFEYYSWKGYSNRLDNDLKVTQLRYADSQQRLNLEQTRLSNQTAEITAQEKRDDVELKNIQLGFAEEAQKLTIKQSELANHATELSLKEKGIDIDVKTLDRDIAIRKNVKILYDCSTHLVKPLGGMNQYSVDCQFDIQNLSKSALMIGSGVWDVFIGHPQTSFGQESSTVKGLKPFEDGATVLVLDPPPDFFDMNPDTAEYLADKNPVIRNGMVWTRVHRDAFRSLSARFANGAFQDRVSRYLRLGGPTGDLASGEQWGYGSPLLVSAPPGYYIGVSLIVFYEEPPGATKKESYIGDNHASATEVLPLSDSETKSNNKRMQLSSPDGKPTVPERVDVIH